MNKNLTGGWNKLSAKFGETPKKTFQKAQVIASSTKGSIISLIDKENICKYNDAITKAVTATGLYLKNSPELFKDFADETVNFTAQLKGMENIEKFKIVINKAAEDTWAHVRESPEGAVAKFKKMDKAYKVLALSAMAGGAVVSIPFVVALGPMSIVSALATLGLGALSAGGYGVAGGLIVTGGGAVLAASLAGTIANKFIDDQEISELIDNYGKLEEIIKQNFQTMENNQEKFKSLYEKYALTANFVIQLKETIENGESYNIDEIRERNNRIIYIIEDFIEAIESEANIDGK